MVEWGPWRTRFTRLAGPTKAQVKWISLIESGHAGAGAVTAAAVERHQAAISTNIPTSLSLITKQVMKVSCVGVGRQAPGVPCSHHVHTRSSISQLISVFLSSLSLSLPLSLSISPSIPLPLSESLTNSRSLPPSLPL